MIKLIATDMDGTLLDGNSRLPEDFYEVYQQLKDKGIKFVAASGRQYNRLLENFGHIAHELIYIGENGGIVRHENEEIHSSTMPREYVMDIIKQAKSFGNIVPVVAAKYCAYINTDDENIIKIVRNYYANIELFQEPEDIKDDIVKIAILDLQGAEENSYKLFYPLWKDKLQIKVSGEHWVDIFSNSTNKGAALKMIQKRYNISKEETMVFGDYFNDVEMLQEAYYSFAMENAPEGVKTHARFIAGSNEENGVIRKIKELVLNN